MPTMEDFAPVLPVVGGLYATGASKTIARENRAFAHNEGQIARDFSERMASTAVQRSVADYRAAGLNPALAYDRSAAAPSASAVNAPPAENYAEKGISTALEVKQMIQALKIAKEQSRADLKVKEQDALLKNRQANLANTQNNEADRQYKFNVVTQPFSERLAIANAMLQEYLMPGAKNTADFERMFSGGRGASFAINSAKTLTEIMKLRYRR